LSARESWELTEAAAVWRHGDGDDGSTETLHQQRRLGGFVAMAIEFLFYTKVPAERPRIWNLKIFLAREKPDRSIER
jgi:hypothetical protein